MTEEDRFADVGRGIRLCYRVDGPDDAAAVLLLAGLGLDLTSWSATFVDGLLDAGLQVIRVDNRDAGRSTRTSVPVPTRRHQLTGTAPAGAYTIEDMAADAVGLLDVLGVDEVHLVGMSLGGMIAQTIAATSPQRVASLTSIFSTTGNRAVGQPARSTILRMARPSASTADAFARRHVSMLGHIGSKKFAVDPAYESRWAREVWSRGASDQRGASVARQIGAINASGDRTRALGNIVAPTLVIHGDRDRMVAPTGGAATASAIPGAEHVTISGLRHHLPVSVAPTLLDLITEHIRDAQGTEARADAPGTDAQR